MVRVPVVRLDPDLPLPSYAHVGDAGVDLRARDDVVIPAAGGRVLVGTGIALALPAGTAGFVQPRSGLALRHGVTVLNSPGLIDSGYRDELKVLLVNLGSNGRQLRFGKMPGGVADQFMFNTRVKLQIYLPDRGMGPLVRPRS